MHRFILGLSCVLVAARGIAADEQFGAQRTTIDIGKHKGFILQPARPAKERPWIWYAPTIGSHPNQGNEWVLRKLLDAGFYVCGINVGESYGSPAGRKVYSDFFQHVVREYKLEHKARLLAQSRGGLMLYNWAAENPDKVRCIVGIYPVCDLRSYPGLTNAAGAYGMTPAELEKQLSQHNPIDRLEPLAKVKVPILHIHGDADTVVPLEKNSQVMMDRYTALGSKMKLIVVPGKGHAEIPEYFQEPRLVEFLREGGFAEGSKNADAIENARFKAVEHVRKLVYHSPQKPGFTSWVGAWIMPDGDLMICFTQATGPIKGRPEAPKEIRDRLNWPPKGAPDYDMTGLDLKNVHLRSNDAGKTWTQVSADPFRSCMNGVTGEAQTALADGTVIRGVFGFYLPYDRDIPKTGFLQRSKDATKTWGKPELALDPEKYTAWPRRIRVLRDGRIVLLLGVDNSAAGSRTREQLGRTIKPMLVVSPDNGMTWNGPIAAVPQDQPDGWTEEFDIAELSNGDLLAIFRRASPISGVACPAIRLCGWQAVRMRSEAEDAIVEKRRPAVVANAKGHI
jgi:pimeloyl-ACP methyl ester carboxylesterase